jgi:hypothetical protein
MKSLLAGMMLCSAVLGATPAWADPTVTATMVMPSRTIVGRLDKPMVVIVVKAPTAASQAGAAHEALRASLMKRYEPATLHPGS